MNAMKEKVYTYYTEKNFATKLPECLPSELNADNTVFVCIGTDRSTGDALGPLVGTLLEQAGFNVIGTLDYTVNGMNLDDRIKEIPKDKTVIAIDACLGQIDSVGRLYCGIGPVRPGAGVDRQLTPIGDYHITGIVNVGGFMEYFVLQNTELSKVMKMADEIAVSIMERFPLDKEVIE